MDRYVIREARAGSNYPQGNQVMAFSTNAGRNNINPPENVYYGGAYAANQFMNMQPIPNPSYGEVASMTTPMFGQNVHPAQGQVMTGIDPRYLANYSDNSAQYIVAGGQPMQSETTLVANDHSFGSSYQNRNFNGAEKFKPKTFTPQVIRNAPRLETPQNVMYLDGRFNETFQSKHIQGEQLKKNPVKVAPTVTGSSAPKKEGQKQVMSRVEKLQALHKSGPRAFSGPVEKVLKWHKALQDIGVFVFYEIVAKCVSIRPGDSCSKNLVIRDDNGPAMQVVYFEIDFLLPEIKVPSTVRVIGRMMAGTYRLQAFTVRPATGDDVATLPRRAAVATHHIAKLCSEYGLNV